MKRINIIVGGIVAILVIAVGISNLRTETGTGPALAIDPITPSETIRAGVMHIPLSLPFAVATDQRLFQTQAVAVETQTINTGKAGLDALLGGSLDVATVAETPLAHLGFQNSDVAVIATMTYATALDVVARGDRGIKSPVDLKGKRVGTIKGTAHEYMLAETLAQAGVVPDTVDIRYLGINELVPALVRGELDAMVSLEPYTSTVREALPDNHIVLSGTVPTLFNLVARKDYIAQHADTLSAFVQSLIDAETYIHTRDTEARALTATFTGISPSVVDSEWSRMEFRISLDPLLRTTLEREGTWLQKGTYPDRSLPDYRTLIDTTILHRVAPNRVTL